MRSGKSLNYQASGSRWSSTPAPIGNLQDVLTNDAGSEQGHGFALATNKDAEDSENTDAEESDGYDTLDKQGDRALLAS